MTLDTVVPDLGEYTLHCFAVLKTMEKPMPVPLITRATQSPAKHDSRKVETSGANLHVVVALCAIGFLLTLYCILRFPDFGAVIAQYNQF